MRVALFACLALATVAAPSNKQLWHKQQVSAAAKRVALSLPVAVTTECAIGLRGIAACAYGHDASSLVCANCSSQLNYALEQCNAQGPNAINAWIAAMDLDNPNLYAEDMRLSREQVAAAFVTLEACRPCECLW